MVDAALARNEVFAKPDTVLRGKLEEFAPNSNMPRWHSDWAWENYLPLILHLAKSISAKTICEIGGGRDPLFTPQDAARNGLELIVNDLDPNELALTPQGLKTACFDIAGQSDGFPAPPNSFDMMVSRMVFEHVPDNAAAWRNVYRLLTPGGVGLAFIPTLYAWPYVVNSMIPEKISHKIVTTLFPNRVDGGGDPKFPAIYDWCFGSERKLRQMLEPIGFSDIVVQPFWGHGYLKSIPIAREIDDVLNWLAMKADIRLVTTYAFIIVRK